MKNFTIDLQQVYGTSGGTLDCLLASSPHDCDTVWKRPAIIVVPGGAYKMTSKREGEPVALEFLSLGFQTFILWYSCGGKDGFSYPEQLIEIATAVHFVKERAEDLNVNPNEVFVVGFSAGGHLTANLAVDYANIERKFGKKLNCKPTAVGLAYPVITEQGHKGSFDNLLYGYTDEARAELIKGLEAHALVTTDTPPAFLWAMAKDSGVKVEQNVLLYAQACAQNGVDFELHIYPQGEHGSSTGRLEINDLSREEACARSTEWTDKCARFFRLYCEEKF